MFEDERNQSLGRARTVPRIKQGLFVSNEMRTLSEMCFDDSFSFHTEGWLGIRDLEESERTPRLLVLETSGRLNLRERVLNLSYKACDRAPAIPRTF